MRSLRAVPLITVAAITVILAGCTAAPSGSSAPEPEVTVPTRTEEPSPPPTTTAPAIRLPNFEDLTLSTEGLGSLLLGKPVTDSDMVEFIPDACTDLHPGYGDDSAFDAGRWRHVYHDHGPRDPFTVNVSDTEVDAIEVTSPAIPTEAGIRVGSTLSELRKAYPALLNGQTGPLSSLHYIQSGDHAMVFEVVTADTTIGNIAVGILDGADAFPRWATDNVVGGC